MIAWVFQLPRESMEDSEELADIGMCCLVGVPRVVDLLIIDDRYSMHLSTSTRQSIPRSVFRSMYVPLLLRLRRVGQNGCSDSLAR